MQARRTPCVNGAGESLAIWLKYSQRPGAAVRTTVESDFDVQCRGGAAHNPGGTNASIATRVGVISCDRIVYFRAEFENMKTRQVEYMSAEGRTARCRTG
jgi:hypothetical protein